CRGINWRINLHCKMNVFYMNNAIAMGSGNLRVYLRDYHFGGLYGRQRHIHRKAQRTKTVFVRRGNLNEDNIQWQNISSEKPVYLAQKNWDIITTKTVHPFSNIIAHKTTCKMKSFGIGQHSILSFSVGMNLDYFNIFKFLIACAQAVYQ